MLGWITFPYSGALIRAGAGAPGLRHQRLAARSGVGLRLLLSGHSEHRQGSVYENSIKDAAGALSRQRRNEILVAPRRPLRAFPPPGVRGPASGQASPPDLCPPLSSVMSVFTISWRRAIGAQLRVSADPRRHSCFLTTAGAEPGPGPEPGVPALMGGNGGFARCGLASLRRLTRAALTSSPHNGGSGFFRPHPAVTF